MPDLSLVQCILAMADFIQFVKKGIVEHFFSLVITTSLKNRITVLHLHKYFFKFCCRTLKGYFTLVECLQPFNHLKFGKRL